MAKYRFLKDVDYAPLDNSYAAGEEAELADWKPEDIASAIEAGQLEALEAAVLDIRKPGRSRKSGRRSRE